MEFNRPTNIIPAPWAKNGQYETIPATQVSSGRASWDTGFPPENTIPVSSGGIPANYNDFQGVLHDLSEHTCFQQTGGMYLWSSSIDYSVGALVQGSDDKIYRALQKNGPNTTVANPVTDSSGKWTSFVLTTGNQAIKGGLTVTSGVTVSGGMIVSGTISGTATNASSLGGVAASGYVTTSGAQTVGGAKTYTGSAVFSSGATFSSGITVSSGATIDSATVTSGATISGGAIVTSGIAADTLTVTSGATISGGISADTLTVSSGATISGDTIANDGLIIKGNNSVSGGLIIDKSSANATIYLKTSGGTYDREINIGVQENNGKAGIFDVTNQKWLLEANSAGNIGPVVLRNDINATVTAPNTSGRIVLCASPSGSATGGAKFYLNGADYSNSGNFTLQAGNLSGYKQLTGEPDGTLTWDGKEFVYTSGNQTLSGVLTINNEIHSRSIKPNTGNSYTLGVSGTRWKEIWCNQSSINTSSDERIKQQIATIPDAVLDAWGDVGWIQFKYNDSVEEKGADKARLHNGLIAQRVDEVFKAHGLDASKYGLFLFDEWEAEPEQVDANGNVTIPAQPAGDAYGLRYTEALCMEAAYQRRRADRAEARISALEQRLNEMEQVLVSMISPISDEQTAEPEQEGEGAE